MTHDAALQVEHRSIDELVPNARNARTHSPAQIKKLEASLCEFGWCNPILVDERNGIVAGHGRLAAAMALRDNKRAAIPNWPDKATVPSINLSHLTEVQRQAYTLADNRLAELSGWDNEILAMEFEDLKSVNFDLALIGFDPADLGEGPVGGEGGEGGGDEPPVVDVDRHLLLLEFDTEQEQQEMFAELSGRGVTCKIMN